MEKLTFLLFWLISVSLFSQTNLDNIRGNLEYLASDVMNGRKTGSPEALKSATFIANQFRSLGLQSPDIAEDYLQEFTLMKSVNIKKSLILNQLDISQDDFVVISSSKSLTISDPSKIQIIYIGEQDDFMQKFSEISGLDDSFMVLIHPAHKQRFARLKNYLTQPEYNLGANKDKFSAWVLSSAESINQLQLTAINRIDEIKGYNVIGVLPAASDTGKLWIFSAHYDHIGIQAPTDGDSIANGANDDASGTVAVIELARIFSKEKTSEKTLWFVAFSAEEMGLFGSESLAGLMDTERIEGMINIEMIGLPNQDLGSASAFISGYELSLWPDKMAQSVPQDKFMFFPDPYPNLQLFMRSDNASFAKYGIPAHSISTYSENDETYHQVSDEIENIDFNNMKLVIDAIYRGAIPLLQNGYQPGKINYLIKSDQ